VTQQAHWKRQPTGLYLSRRGDIRLMIEQVGSNFRVMVTRVIDENRPEEVLYTGSARNADDAMMLADRIAEQAAARVAA